jgi:hypothetical protein
MDSHAAWSPVHPCSESLESPCPPRHLGTKRPHPDRYRGRRGPDATRSHWQIGRRPTWAPMAPWSIGTDGPSAGLVACATRHQGARFTSISWPSRGQRRPGAMPPRATWSRYSLDTRAALSPRCRNLHGMLTPRWSNDHETWVPPTPRDQATDAHQGPGSPRDHGARGGTRAIIAGHQGSQVPETPWPAVHLGRDIPGSIPIQGAHRNLASRRLGPGPQSVPWLVG